MRNNQPVTGQLYEFSADTTLMSTTDTRGRIVYANAAFVDVSGFTRTELQGQPHNIVRHPEMPPEAFADMWHTLRAGQPWTGLVKNRRKNGDHYWVRANTVPIVRNGQQTGYMSVRTPALATDSAAAEQFYQHLRTGTTRQQKLHKGILVYSGLKAVLSWGRTMGVRTRIRLLIGSMALLSVGGAFAIRTLGGEGGMVLLWILLLAGCIGLLLEQHIAKPLEQVQAMALNVATGANHMPAHIDRVDEIGMTLRTVSQLGQMFRWLIDDVASQATSVQHAVREIAQGNVDLSHRTEQAAHHVAQTSALMAQITESVHHSAQTAVQAQEMAGGATQSAHHGSHTMQQVIATMQTISQSSHQIADITSLIDGIAFQTNILALNAAVEAARAGEQGRGFAVVADEVRTLAQRSAQAAKEIKALIDNSTHQVETGTQLVDAAGQAMSDIQHRVQQVSSMIETISASAQSQSTKIVQINDALARFDAITQQNAALVEQAAAASACLHDQSTHLAEAVQVFR
ncbi:MULTISPECIES: methyl-accepting chemotaxis protein [Giesbergeria]|uniref:Methyl-accepting chemotaxis protein n=1 Tax=Giesbergeria sinuosa TaxID=80883 RepID=A0ABV9QFZ8_9BURK